MNSSAGSAALATALGVMACLFVIMPTHVSAQTELKISEDSFPALKPVPMPSFPELQPGPSDSKYAACNNGVVPFNSGSQKALQVYIDMTSRRARCIEADTAGSEALYDKSIVDLYQQKYTELSAVLVASQEILDGEQSISKKQLIDYSSYVNEEIGLLMVLSAYAECKALEANSLAMKVDPKCDTDRLQEIIATREQDGRAQHAHTQSLFKAFELEPFRKLPAIATPQELIALVAGRQYRPIGAAPRKPLNSVQAPRTQNNAELPSSCARLVALMGNADYWREQANDLLGEAAMVRDAARGWRVISLSAREGAEYARKSGIASSEQFLRRKAEELEKRAQEYEAKAKNKEDQAKLLSENADAEDAARLKHLANWCVKYQNSPETAFAPESVKIEFELALSRQQGEPISDREDVEYLEYGVMHIDQEIYTEDDIKQFLDRWRSSQFANDPWIIGAGQGLGRDLMVLADFRPDLVLLLLNELSKLDAGNLEGVLELVKLIREKAQDPEKIAELYKKSFNDYWMAKLTHIVERMQETIEIQISVIQPATVTPERDPATHEAAKDCPRFTLDTSADTEYWRSLADIADAEAISARERAKSWRDIARQAADGAAQAGKDGNTSSQKFQNAKAEELNQRANDLDARAADKENEAADLRRKAEAEDNKRCDQRNSRNRTAKGPEPSTVDLAPEPPRQTIAPGQSQYVCGPDITNNVLRVLDQMKKDFQGWNVAKRNEKCRDLYNPVTAGTAWDIKQLSPEVAPMREWKFDTLKILSLKWGASYEKYLEKNFWFEGHAASCAKPRSTCGFTVRFLGKCMHAQVVNYVQWGMINKLCGYDDGARSAAWLWNVATPTEIYHSQKVMAGIGKAYAELREHAGSFDSQSTTSGTQQDQQRQSKKQMTDKMNQLITDPSNYMFRIRPGANCSKCNATPAEAEKLNNLKFDYEWGSLPFN